MKINETLTVGYCCINTELQKKGISVNRTCIKRTFVDKGMSYVSELAASNLYNLIKILEWNSENNITVYRMSSNMIPWMSEYELKDMPNYETIKLLLVKAGEVIRDNSLRVSFHPGPFNVLCSPKKNVVTKTIKELNQHAEIMDLMGLEKTTHFPINIHCNGVYGDKTSAMERFCKEFQKLSDSTKRRLVIENDDKASMYSVQDLYDGIHSKIGIPITFDYHHHRFCTGGLSEYEAFVLARTTWKTKPIFHYSSCSKISENTDKKLQAHADFVYEHPETYGYSVDIELEVKMKEQALLQYSENWQTLTPSSKFQIRELITE